MFQNRLLPLAAAALLAAIGLMPHDLRAQDPVVAKVNGKSITEADMKLAEAEIGNDLGNLPAAQKRRVLAEYLIENQLFADAAEAEKLSDGAAFAERLQYWRRRALRDAYFDKSIRSAIGEGAAKTFYDDQVKQLKPEEEVQARHILVDTKEKAQEIAGKIASGTDFATLAKAESKDPGSKDDGGMLGYFSRGQMVPQFEEAAYALQKGEVSPPVQSQFGFHLIKVEDRRQKPHPTFDEVKDRILGSMIQRKAQEVANNLRGGAAVEYVDADIKKQVEEANKQADQQRKTFEEQIKKLDQDSKQEAPPKQ